MFIKILQITLPIFIIILIGFFYSKYTKPDLASTNKLVVDIALPILIFTSLATKDFNPQTALLFTFGTVLLIFLSGLLAFATHKLSGTRWQAFAPSVMFVNVGPIGIPLIVLAFGADGLAPAVILLVISNILHFTVGAGLMSGKIDWRMLYANPLVWATVLGVAVSQSGISLPTWLVTPLTMLGNVLVPMMLLSLGGRLSTSQISDAKVGFISSVLAIGIRLICAFLILKILPLQGVERGAFILFTCLPSAVFNFMLADKFKIEPQKVASIVVVGHIASLVFLPLGIWLAFA
jgi:malate permease and related proteins